MANNIQVPAYLQGAVGRILEGVDSARGAETTPVPMSLNEKDIEENPDSTKSVLFKAKIHVDKNKRTQVRDEIVEYLNGILDSGDYSDFKEVISGTKTKPDAEQFDVVYDYMSNKPQIIRI